MVCVFNLSKWEKKKERERDGKDFDDKAQSMHQGTWSAGSLAAKGSRQGFTVTTF